MIDFHYCSHMGLLAELLSSVTLCFNVMAAKERFHARSNAFFPP